MVGFFNFFFFSLSIIYFILNFIIPFFIFLILFIYSILGDIARVPQSNGYESSSFQTQSSFNNDNTGTYSNLSDIRTPEPQTGAYRPASDV